MFGGFIGLSLGGSVSIVTSVPQFRKLPAADRGASRFWTDTAGGAIEPDLFTRRLPFRGSPAGLTLEFVAGAGPRQQ